MIQEQSVIILDRVESGQGWLAFTGNARGKQTTVRIVSAKNTERNLLIHYEFLKSTPHFIVVTYFDTDEVGQVFMLQATGKLFNRALAALARFNPAALALAERCRPGGMSTPEFYRYMALHNRRLEGIVKAHEDKNWYRYVAAHDRWYQLTAILWAAQQGFSGEPYWKVLRYVWTMIDNPGANATIWLELFSRDDELGRRSIMTVDDRRIFDTLPETLTLYRGALPKYRLGISWTLEQEVAERFAKQWGGKVYTVTLPRAAVMLYFGARLEAEVLVNPRDLPKPKLVRI